MGREGIMGIKKHLGTLSLLFVATFFVTLEAVLRMGVYKAPWIRILVSGFEAGTVGALADWFAVSALFREVPIPFLRRHTNILLKKREALTEQIVDVVQNQWLTPKTIGEYISQRSPSSALLEYLGEPRHEAQLLVVFRDILSALVERMDGPEMRSFLADMVRRQIDRSDLERLIGERLEEAIRRGEHTPLVHALLGLVESSVREGTLRDLVRGWVQEAARSYASRGTMKAATTWVLEKSGGLDYRRVAEDVVSSVAGSVRGIRGRADHPLRVQFDEAASQFARGLAEGNPAQRSAWEKIRLGLLQGLESESGLRGILERVKETVKAQLTDPNSAIMLASSSFLRGQLAELRGDRALCQRLDAWVLATAQIVVERNPAMIGEMIRTSLMRLEGPQLVGQIEGKVGPELQYIRLNGAVIGTLVGLGLGGIRWMLG
jgi:uncharacterized membrane-anchored protein YjiN (DUF445 family)